MRSLSTFAMVCFFLTTANYVAAVEYDIAINGGRVIDPETELDAIRSIGILDNRIAQISNGPLRGAREIDAADLVVSPGFIDLHTHGQSQKSHEYQAHDGVTTALELEAGQPNLREWLASKEGKSLVNYGASSSWSMARAAAMDKLAPKLERLQELIKAKGAGHPEVIKYQMAEMSSAYRDSLSASQIKVMTQLVKEELYAGGIGIGLLAGYAPGATHDEIFRLFEFAAEFSAPIFVHVCDPGIVGIQEVMTNAIIHGAPLHIVHVNSMALGEIKLAIDMVETAKDKGFDVTTEMYPYTAASTYIESNLFDEGWQTRLNISYKDLQWVKTGERLNEETFAKYRAEGGAVIIHMMKESWIKEGLRRESTMIASDGMPYSPGAHPRSAGTFSRVLGKYVREENALSLNQAIKKMTLMPAQRLEAFAPAANRKGRIQIGADADITIFNPATVIDKATFEEGLKFSDGIAYVVVNGKLIIDNGETVAGILPGKALIGKYRR